MPRYTTLLLAIFILLTTTALASAHGAAPWNVFAGKETQCRTKRDLVFPNDKRVEKSTANLLLTGRQQNFGNAFDTVQSFIVDKLRLPHLQWKVLQAKEWEEGIFFEMADTTVAAEVVKQAELLLRPESFGIVAMPDLDIFTTQLVASMARMGDA